MASFSAEKLWSEAKKAFETTATKKRPGMNPLRMVKFLKSYKSITGMTPVSQALDEALNKTEVAWSKADLPAKAKMVATIEKCEAALKTKGTDYIKTIEKSIGAELQDGDGSSEMMRALENMRNAVEVILKGSKVQRVQYQTQLESLKSGKDATSAIKDGWLLSSPASLDKAIAGMKSMVRNVKAKPTLEVWMEEISGDPATRWATTKLKDLAASFKKYPELERKVGADPMEFQKRLNIYGAGWDSKWWIKELGDPKNYKSEILKHAQAIEKQIPNIEILSTRLKAALKELKV